MGAFFAWIGLSEYIEGVRASVIFSKLMQKIIPLWIYTVIAVMPIFLSFCALTYGLYHQSKDWNTFGKSSTALFAIYHGDSIAQFVTDPLFFSNPVNEITIMVYTMLSAMAIYNFFTSVIGVQWGVI